jgi:hypothetical protein
MFNIKKLIIRSLQFKFPFLIMCFLQMFFNVTASVWYGLKYSRIASKIEARECSQYNKILLTSHTYQRCSWWGVLDTTFVIKFVSDLRLNATFNNISVISWQQVLLVEETWVPRENHWPVASHWQILFVAGDVKQQRINQSDLAFIFPPSLNKVPLNKW